MNASARQTKRLITGEGLRHGYDGDTLFEGLDVILTAGMRLGIVGPNGAGKSTLLHILLGTFDPLGGTVKRADQLQAVMLDQNRRLPDEKVSLRRALCESGDAVIYRGRVIHVVAWAKRFLFAEEQLVQPVAQLSGGERARVLLANLMLQPADVLFLDEPTNDLDIPTLEVLEENLQEFEGAIVLVTHDRFLLDRVATQVLALEGDGAFGVYAEYSQWEADRTSRTQTVQRSKSREEQAAPAQKPISRRKLSYLDQREWDSMEQRILEAEEALAEAEREGRYTDIETAQKAVEELYARWVDLEAKLTA